LALREHPNRGRRYDVRDYPLQHAIAYDLKKGKQIWRYEHKLGTTIFCCGPNNRGVAVHGPHVYMGDLGTATWWTQPENDGQCPVGTSKWAIQHSATASPRAARHRRQVIVGVSGGEYGIRGYVTRTMR
jgi:hypothetical protein